MKYRERLVRILVPACETRARIEQEQPIYNPGERTITVLISLEDTAKGWWQRSVDIPPRVPVLLRVPMDEARLSVDPGHIRRWLLWEADPPAAIEFRLGTPMLAPAGMK